MVTPYRFLDLLLSGTLNNLPFEARRTQNVVTQAHQIAASHQRCTTLPVLIAGMQTTDDDTATVRCRSLNPYGV